MSETDDTDLSIHWVSRTYAMHAASSDRKCTCGLSMNVLIVLLFFGRTTRTHTHQWVTWHTRVNSAHHPSRTDQWMASDRASDWHISIEKTIFGTATLKSGGRGHPGLSKLVPFDHLPLVSY